MKTLIPTHSFPPPAIISRRLALSLSLPLHLSISPALSSPCPSPPTTASKSFLDISIDGIPVGRITIALLPSASAARFSSLSLRRKAFVRISPTFVQLAAADLTAAAAADLASEWVAEANRCAGLRSTAGAVGIVVRNPAISPPAKRIVARSGRIEVVEEEAAPIGTEVVIATRDAPEMDERAVVVGRVVDGMEVVEKIAGVSAVRDNSGSPYFRLAKLIGDKRAAVAERGFNRPFAKVVVTDSGLLMD